MNPDEFEGLQFGTRATSKSRKRLGRGRQSSAIDDAPSLPADNLLPKKMKNKSTSSSGVENGAVGTMAVLRGIDKCFVGARRGAKGLRGALDKNKSRISLTANGGEMDYFETTLTRFDPMLKDRSNLVESHLARNGLSWLWRMQIDYNILFFGVGCKRSLLSKFVGEFLHGNEVLMIDGDSDFSASSNRIIKELLDGICIKILKRQDLWSSCIDLESYVKIIGDSLDIHYCREVARKIHKPLLASHPEIKYPQSFVNFNSEGEDHPLTDISDCNHDNEEASLPNNTWSNSNYVVQKRSASLIGSRATTASSSTRIADPKWGGRYSHAQAKLYIVVRSIDGESLQSEESQMCLSLLAACSSVSMIATAESLNTPVMWSPQLLSKFRWANYHVPTYESYAFNPTEVNSLGGGSKEFPGGARALEYIFKSLTKRHEELVSMLAKDAIKQCETDKIASSSMINESESGSTASYRGMNIEELLVETSRSVVARSMPELNTLLQELIDHKIVNKAFDSQRKLFVWITLPLHTLRKLAAFF